MDMTDKDKRFIWVMVNTYLDFFREYGMSVSCSNVPIVSVCNPNGMVVHVENENQESFIKLECIVDLIKKIYRECGYDQEEALNSIEYEVDDYVDDSCMWWYK